MNEMYNRIEELLKKRGMTFYQLAQETGISNGRFTDLHVGRCKTLSLKNINIVAEYLGVTPEYIKTGDRDSIIRLDLENDLVNTKLLVRLMTDKQLQQLLVDVSVEMQRRQAQANAMPGKVDG